MSIPFVENDDDKDSAPEFCLDAGPTGNVARFINHSCQPNLFVQCVLSNHHDLKQARVVLFAADNIPPMKVNPLSLYIYIYMMCVRFGISIIRKACVCKLSFVSLSSYFH